VRHEHSLSLFLIGILPLFRDETKPSQNTTLPSGQIRRTSLQVTQVKAGRLYESINKRTISKFSFKKSRRIGYNKSTFGVRAIFEEEWFSAFYISPFIYNKNRKV